MLETLEQNFAVSTNLKVPRFLSTVYMDTHANGMGIEAVLPQKQEDKKMVII